MRCRSILWINSAAFTSRMKAAARRLRPYRFSTYRRAGHVISSDLFKDSGLPLIRMKLMNTGKEIGEGSRARPELDDTICIRIIGIQGIWTFENQPKLCSVCSLNCCEIVTHSAKVFVSLRM